MTKYLTIYALKTLLAYSFLCVLIGLIVSCSNATKRNISDDIPKNAKKIQLVLEDSLGKVMLYVPNKYDTVFSWVNYSDCGKSCDERKYRFQLKGLPIIKESGWVFLNTPKDSVEQLTITHKEFFPFHDVDTTKNIRRHNFIRFKLSHDETNPPIIFDTLQKNGDRYYSIFAMQKLASITVKKVVAVTTIKNNLITFEYELLTKQKDSITTNFIRNSLALIKTIHISSKP